MLKQITCYVVDCDVCGDTYEHDYTPHYSSAVVEGDIDPWVVLGDQHFCEDCAAKPHDFVPDEYDPEDCARCNMTVSEHLDVDAAPAAEAVVR